MLLDALIRAAQFGVGLYTLQCAREVRGKVDRGEPKAVRMAREAGVSWTEIAASLGVSRQAAWERWHEIDHEVKAAT